MEQVTLTVRSAGSSRVLPWIIVIIEHNLYDYQWNQSVSNVGGQVPRLN